MDEVTRRSFLAGALALGASAAVPLHLVVRAAPSAGTATGHYLTTHERLTCDAICSRIVPTDADPGAHEAAAVDFIDFFLSAFELPPSVADNPGIYLHGRYSGRNPYADHQTGLPSEYRPASDFVDATTGTRHFLPLDAQQTLSWRATLYGAAVLTKDTSLPKPYRDAVAAGLIPVPAVGLRDAYRAGLAAFDNFAQTLGQTDFASAPAPLQDAMLTAVGNVVLGGVFGAVPLPVGPPPAAVALFVPISVHSFQACFGLPEYGSRGGPPFWAWIRWDGDTQPLGNSVYDAQLTDAGIDALGGVQGTNAGFGDPAVYTPRGGYREHREVSTNRLPGPALSRADALRAADALRQAGLLRPNNRGTTP